MKERQLEQLAEDYRLEINELKAKLTNMAYQAKHLKVCSYKKYKSFSS